MSENEIPGAPLTADDIRLAFIPKAKRLGITREQIREALAGNPELLRVLDEEWPA